MQKCGQNQKTLNANSRFSSEMLFDDSISEIGHASFEEGVSMISDFEDFAENSLPQQKVSSCRQSPASVANKWKKLKNISEQKSYVKEVPKFILIQSCKYHGVKISVQNQELLSFSRDVCLVPFQTTSLACFPATTIEPFLQYDVYTALKYFEEEDELGDGAVIALPAKGIHLFKEIYFLKSSSKKYLKTYSSDLLEESIKKLLRKMMINGYESIAIPRVDWSGLTHKEAAIVLIRSIFRFCRENSFGRVKEISIFVSDRQAYAAYSSVMREFCDAYTEVLSKE